MKISLRLLRAALGACNRYHTVCVVSSPTGGWLRDTRYVRCA